MTTPSAIPGGIPSIHALLQARARAHPNNIAIQAPGRAPLSYAQLLDQVEETVRILGALGYGRDARIALVLPNGPEMAVAFLAVSACATSAPLNPAYRGPEFDRYLAGLRVAAVIVQAGIDTPAVAAAQRQEVSVIRLQPQPDAPAGAFSLVGQPTSRGTGSFGNETDVALLLSTSGTTATPKRVPLTHANIHAAAFNVVRALGLSPADRCLNVMPFFHVHGSIGALVASIAAGGAVVCMPGFHGPTFARVIREYEPTWFTAVPAIHQAVLSRVLVNRETLTPGRLRVVRSCSAPLPSRVSSGLEDVLGIPVIEAYGMTEAAHQITSNPMPPGKRKRGSVGLPVGMELAILDPSGNALPPGSIGEVALRGPNLMAGYEGEGPAATNVERAGEWFHTGDQGRLDEEGYLYLTGRIKELINRAGAKISPAEIDEVLLGHPAVLEATTFALPHSTLGEDVAAAVVVRPDGFATEREIREFARRSLAEFKVPSRVVLVDEIPRGPTGKAQRIGMAERLGLGSFLETSRPPPAFVPPRTDLEQRLATIWAQILGCENVGIHTDFSLLGGDSLLGLELFLRVCEEMQVRPSLVEFFETLTVAAQARVVARSQHGGVSHCSIAVQSAGSRPPLFCVTAGTDISYLRNLGMLLAPDQPLYALYPRALLARQGRYTPELAAEEYVAEIRAIQPEGPYLLSGWCAGSAPALEVGRLLLGQRQEVALLALFVPVLGGSLDGAWRSIWKILSMWSPIDASDRVKGVVHGTGRTALRRSLTQALRDPRPSIEVSRIVQTINRRALRDSVRKGYAARVTLILTRDSLVRGRLDAAWTRSTIASLDVRVVAGDHGSLVEPPHVRDLAATLRACLDEATAASRTTLTPASLDFVIGSRDDPAQLAPGGGHAEGRDGNTSGSGRLRVGDDGRGVR